MKRVLSVIVAMMLMIGCIGAYAETNGNPPEMPSGEMGQPPEGMGEPPQGGPGGDMGNPPDGMGGPGGEGGPGGGPAPSGGSAPSDNAEKPEGMIGSWSSGGSEDYEYDAALYITGEGIDGEMSSTDRIASGEYDASGADGIVIEDTRSGDNGIIVVNADYAISGANISLLTDADGSNTCDFSGRGSAIAVYGSESSVTMAHWRTLSTSTTLCWRWASPTASSAWAVMPTGTPTPRAASRSASSTSPMLGRPIPAS